MGASSKRNLLLLQLVLNSVLGLLFQREAAQLFSISAEKSIFDIAYTFPFSIMEVLGLTFVHTILVAQFINEKHAFQQDKIFFSAIYIILILVSPIIFVLYVFDQHIADLLAPGLNYDQALILADCLKILLPILIIMPISFVITARQQAIGQPIGQEFILMISRFLAVIYLIYSSNIDDLEDFCSLVTYTIVISFFIQLTLNIKPLYNADLRINKKVVLTILFNLSQFVILGALAQFSAIYLRSLLTTTDPKLVSVWMYSMYLVEPIGNIFGRVIAFTSGISLAKESSSNNVLSLEKLFKYFLHISLLSLPLFLIAVYFLDSIIDLAFGALSFSSDDKNLLQNTIYILIPSVIFSIFKWLIVYPVIMDTRGSVIAAFAPAFLIQILVLYGISEQITLFKISLLYVFTLIIQCICGTMLLTRKRKI